MATDYAKVRNVGIVGHGGTGKTTLIEHLLHATGKTPRLGTIEQGNTVGDYLPEEISHKHTTTLKLMHVDWHGARIHLVDHPGYLDFIGELASSSAMLDGMVIVIDAASGPRAGSDVAMKYAEKYSVPRVVFLNKLDTDNLDYEAIVSRIQVAYGKGCVPIVVPNATGAAFKEVASVLNGATGALKERIAALRAGMMDAIAESDDELLEKYLDTGELSHDDFERGLRAGIKKGTIVPIIAGSASRGLGLNELLDLIIAEFPSPLERRILARNGTPDPLEVKVSPAAPFLGQVFRSVVDPHAGHLTMFRVLSGTLKSESEFYNVTTGVKERTGKIFLMNGKTQEIVDEVGPGDLAAMTKLKHTHFSDTIAAPGFEFKLPKIELPESLVKRAIVAKSRADDDKIGEALNRLAEEDPTFSHHRDPATREHVILGMGEMQLEILVERMRTKYHVNAETRLPKVAFKETVKGTAEVRGKHKKQSGGHGQYGDVHIRVSPNTRGGGYKFVDSVVGGSVPRQYIPAVDKGCQESLDRGVIAGFPVVDIVVELFDGSSHDVDSSEMAFKVAAHLAIHDGIMKAHPCLLEPIVEIAVTVPIEFMGDITGNLSARRGRILGMDSDGGHRETIRACVPEAEILRYSADLRSMSQGLGAYTLKFSHYEEVPEHIAQPLMAAFQQARAAGE
jgi:elongation factor G